MGNELNEGNEIKENKQIEEHNEYIKYGIISKKDEERTNEDNVLYLSDLQSSSERKNKIHFGLFGVFDGHNNDYASKYLKDNCEILFEEEAGDINKDNYQQKMEKIFKILDINLKKEFEKKEKNDINDVKNINVDENEIDFYKKIIKNTKETPEDIKNIENSDIKDLLLFRNLFKYNNNYLYNNTDIDYIGSSASIILINNNNIITADLGITKCILFDKEGKILNKKEQNELLNSEYVFENKKEKKRIKKYNESIDYDELKNNIYIPTSRCFGFFKYKSSPILNQENQIISCIPEVNIYNRDSVDFILLMTKGMLNILKDDPNNLNELKDIIITKFKENNDNINISQILNEYIDKKIKEKELKKKKLSENNKIENNTNNENKKENKNNFNSVYVGKEDFEEENEAINALKKIKYKKIIDLNKDEYYSCHDKYNITCALIKLLDKKYPDIEIIKKENDKKDENKNIKNDITKEIDINKKKENKDETNKENKIENEKKEIEDKKISINEENKNEEKKEEIEENKKEN